MKALFSVIFFGCITAYGQQPKLVFFKNGNEIEANNFSFKKGDLLEVQILNNNTDTHYRIACIDLTVIPSSKYQEIRRNQIHWKKYCKTKFQLSDEYSQSPRIELKYKSLYNKECTRLIVSVLKVFEKDITGNGDVTSSDKFTLSKEYSFWNEERPI